MHIWKRKKNVNEGQLIGHFEVLPFVHFEIFVIGHLAKCPIDKSVYRYDRYKMHHTAKV